MHRSLTSMRLRTGRMASSGSTLILVEPLIAYFSHTACSRAAAGQQVGAAGKGLQYRQWNPLAGVSGDKSAVRAAQASDTLDG